MEQNAEKSRLQWTITQEDTYGAKLFLRSGKKISGELSISFKKQRALPHSHPYSYIKNEEFSDEMLKRLRQEARELGEFGKDYLEALDTPLSNIAMVSMWTIFDEARGNLHTLRNLLRTVLPVLERNNIEYIVGQYVSQGGDGLTPATYAPDMYKRLAELTKDFGSAQHGPYVWIPTAGLRAIYKKALG